MENLLTKGSKDYEQPVWNFSHTLLDDKGDFRLQVNN